MSARKLSFVLVGTLVLAGFVTAAGPVPSLPVPSLMPNVPLPLAELAQGPPAQWQDLVQANEHALLGAVQLRAAVPTPILPSTGIRAILQLSGAPLDSFTPEQLAAYDALPAQDRDALGTLLAAYLDSAKLTQLAFAVPITQAQMDAATGSNPTAPLPPINFALLLLGQREMVAATQAALPVLQRDVKVMASLPVLLACPGVDIDAGVGTTVHACDVRFSLDMGGDDIYTNNAGGVGESIQISGNNGAGTAAFALDLAGNDQYLG
ncbi:MAG: hypothetical protein LC624_03790, partial [Halobacteriales archaeon]|nr:hypothetical protein [Halobacteriales archaeon]